MNRFISILICLLLCGAFPVVAEETAASGVVSTENAQGLKEELSADKQKIVEQKAEIKQNAQAGKLEEKELHKQIREAQAAGDQAKVKELRAQLKSTHQENVAQKKKDKNELKTAKKELRTDRKTALKKRADRNKDGTVDKTEKAKAKKRGWWGL